MNEKGMTLVEILASIVILSIIIVSLLSMIVQSSRTNAISKNITSATYVAESTMEELNGTVAQSTDLASSFPIELKKLTDSSGNPKYNILSNTNGLASIETTVPGYYVYIEANSTSGSTVVKVKVKVYKDKTKAKIEAKMEMLLAWKKS
ncbi:prepilin-type N-terminal cleavage/methylation domain-containing protein [Neobacillus cucumis]|uniref:prepilin-type N-terminal cleavage/methylation domain-containing protein n=1 Tax=Neobacillus cucumis TaxID=1740721 RepID=UPI002852F54E|nr:prepilin-type N-terminal cleavage/methylation domain-containing protein [Neobacillus cucumis]MDR4948760.1 prepilin-type N-terminal cleavage/methylation domain-containing protein [Neobacillus cucumis]